MKAKWILLLGFLATSLAWAGPRDLMGQSPFWIAQDLDRDFQDHQERAADRLTPEEIQSLHSYTGELYRQMNSGLRSRNLSDGLKEVGCEIDHAIEKSSPGARKFYVFRGHGYLPKGSDQPGYEFAEAAYLSTSLNPATAEKFASFSDGPKVVDIIDFGDSPIPGIWVDALSAYRDLGANSGEGAQADAREFELLLTHGLRLRVTEVETASRFLMGKLTYRHLKVVGRDSVSLCGN